MTADVAPWVATLPAGHEPTFHSLLIITLPASGDATKLLELCQSWDPDELPTCEVVEGRRQITLSWGSED